jgi:hypothetical protein
MGIDNPLVRADGTSRLSLTTDDCAISERLRGSALNNPPTALMALHANGEYVWKRGEPIVDAFWKDGAGVLQVAQARICELDGIRRVAIQIGDDGA